VFSYNYHIDTYLVKINHRYVGIADLTEIPPPGSLLLMDPVPVTASSNAPTLWLMARERFVQLLIFDTISTTEAGRPSCTFAHIDHGHHTTLTFQVEAIVAFVSIDGII